ncbi:MAG: hypothetical protein CV087_19620 [Candidatus Brocadia sp. WS118]|nr:MAG: hypothetical protein CV087_19620 [Candidatus Brocadia sp. WS118]
MPLHIIPVHAYSGYKSNERPLSFVFEGNTHKIKKIISHTYEEIPGKGRRRMYAVKTDEGLTYKLLYDENQGQWLLEE